MRKLFPNSIFLFSTLCVSVGYAQTEPIAEPAIPAAAVESELEGLLPEEPVQEQPLLESDDTLPDETLTDEPLPEEPLPEVEGNDVPPPPIVEEEVTPLESEAPLDSVTPPAVAIPEDGVISGDVISGPVIDNAVIDNAVIDNPVIDNPVIDNPVVSGEVIQGSAPSGAVTSSAVHGGVSHGGVVSKSYANGPHFGHGQFIHNAPSYVGAAIRNSMNYATATPYTFYDPYYYGWHGNFYPHSGLQFRGWSIWRRWTNLYPPGGLAFYPSHYQAHFAKYPRDYFYPYYYQPSYTGHVNVVPVMYRYPHVPIIYTKPYVPLFGANEAKSNPAEVDFNEDNLPVKLTAENIAQMSIRMGEGETLRFVSLQDEPNEAAAAKPAKTAFDTEQATELYGIGYHEFYRGNHEEALKYFAKAIESIEDDARVWYYKGLSEAALGDEAAAVRSLGQAVRLHIDHPEQNAAINKSLSRVQGTFRVQLLDAKRAAESALLKRNSNDLQG